ncbi:acetyl-CoA hydrolase/transferase C-terminal domain-containing protein [Phreatobacter stygius]|uniref:Acetyl-CoA hydrolase n=1 Tax=Phreatobacter stygius TaxID=1940610 RepID=A0A4D7BIM1_9HYPH|nr:acetyl-CoA hydrolase/transferase C-terminal domain-containing protein [Phreatobacter stygius]QCI67627.1 acetyl-CoA hydrolase [Phreatobacter stygius]
MSGPAVHSDAAAIADRIIDELDGRIVLGLPLGLGKSVRIADALFARAAADRAIRLDIFTALTLEPPRWSSDMERRFVEPLNQRLFAGYQVPAYARALRDGTLPDNVTVSEFFLQAGRWLEVPAMQQAYISANYTHAARYIFDRGLNVIAQLVARRGEGEAARYSLSCNSDTTLDLLPRLKASGRKFLLVGEVNSALPFMAGEAALPASAFKLVLETPGAEPRLFAPPKEPVSDADHAIGIHAASLVKDGGTLQIGIGSLGDAVTAALIMRHRDPELFAETLRGLDGRDTIGERETGRFDLGLYATSEMFVDGFAELYRERILKRRAADGALLHAGFFVGSEDFYRFLRDLPDAERDLFQMRPISFVNEIFGDEAAKRRDRVDARFVNSAMMVTLLGDVVSDGLGGGRVVSGVGGQYNFVAQAFALDGARSIITLNAWRRFHGERHSRLLWNSDHTTIPRHLRDIVITEYGVADLRGRSDRDCIVAMLAIADQKFQGELAAQARKSRKLEAGFRLPDAHRDNTRERIAGALRAAKARGFCQPFPFGTAFTDEERKLLPALALLRDRMAGSWSQAWVLLASLMAGGAPDRHGPELRRMALDVPKTMSERLYRRVLTWALDQQAG